MGDILTIPLSIISGVIGVGGAAAANEATEAGGDLEIQGIQQKTQAQIDTYNYQSGVAQAQALLADQNAKIAKQNEAYSLMVGDVQAGASGLGTRQRLGAITAGQAASGFDVTSDSFADVRESQAQAGRTDQSIIRQNAAKQAYDYDISAYQSTEQGKIYHSASPYYDKAIADTQAAGDIATQASQLSTDATVASRWFQVVQSFLPSPSSMWSGKSSPNTSSSTSIPSSSSQSADTNQFFTTDALY